jgi:hypothetical protein
MPSLVRITSPVRSEDGNSTLSVGLNYSVSDSFADELVYRACATPVNFTVPRSQPSAAQQLRRAGGSEVVFSDGTSIQASVLSDYGVDHVASGMLLPTSGGLSNFGTAGVAVVLGRRIALASLPMTLIASQDNYIDLSYAGVALVTGVAVSAAAPPVPSQCLRLGFVRTNTTSVTSATQTGKDSLGNWLSNRFQQAACVLSHLTSQAGGTVTVAFGAGSEVLDNDYMHSVASNNSRITINRAGLYDVGAVISLAAVTPAFNYGMIYKNGLALPVPSQFVSSAGNYLFMFGRPLPLFAGDYLEVVLTGTTQLSAADFWAIRR